VFQRKPTIVTHTPSTCAGKSHLGNDFDEEMIQDRLCGIVGTLMVKKAGPMNSQAITVRRAQMDDAEALQTILNDVIEEGAAFLSEEPKSLEQTKQIWLTEPAEAYVACDPTNGEIMGAYMIKPNAHGRGAHVANATYMVKRNYRGQGLGYLLGSHSLKQARQAGYRAMQFNSVVSVNTASVTLWQRLGFERIGTVPQGFRLRNGHCVDTYIMYRSLDEISVSDT
jgi:L-amino acid N-acyltransferase YncA